MAGLDPAIGYPQQIANDAIPVSNHPIEMTGSSPVMSASREDALSARWKSVPGMVAIPEIEGNCVAARRGGEQPEVNRQSVG